MSGVWTQRTCWRAACAKTVPSQLEFQLAKSHVLALGFIGALILSSGITASANAANVKADPPVRIVKVGTDQMGTDTFQGRNREYVTFENVSGADLNVAGFVVEDLWSRNNKNPHRCNKYVIGSVLPDQSDAVLPAGKRITVFNGIGRNQKTVDGNYWLFANSNYRCGYRGHFLNNNKDTVFVSSSSDSSWVAQKSWDWQGGYYIQ